MRRLALAALLLLVPACGGDPEPVPTDPDGRLVATLGDVELRLELADEPAERAVGLMGRTEVPPGTGMLFRYDEPVEARFYMFRVPVPLVATFVRDGVVVHRELMPPCEDDVASECPTYGSPTPYDTVVETSPETAEPFAVGDRLTVEG